MNKMDLQSEFLSCLNLLAYFLHISATVTTLSIICILEWRVKHPFTFSQHFPIQTESLWQKCIKFPPVTQQWYRNQCTEYTQFFPSLPMVLTASRILTSITVCLQLFTCVIIPLGMSCVSFCGSSSKKRTLRCLAFILNVASSGFLFLSVTWYAVWMTKRYRKQILENQVTAMDPKWVFGKAIYKLFLREKKPVLVCCGEKPISEHKK